VIAARVLGSAAGGGVPQWNCGCFNCCEARDPAGRVTPRTQDSLAVRIADNEWLLINASPDVRAQLSAWPELHPREPRHSPVMGVLLTNGDLDHTLGLLSLRERQPLTVYATDRVRDGLMERNVMMRTLTRFPGQLSWVRLPLDQELELQTRNGEPSGLCITARSVPGKLPVHLDLQGTTSPHPEDNIALAIRARGQRAGLLYATAVSDAAPLTGWIAPDDVLLCDGSFFASEELIALDPGQLRAEQMAHGPLGGGDGALARLRHVDARRKVLTHINNTNPILDPLSPERARVEAEGWEVAYDGMDVSC
jgi:pyrroloquinoline quinone biosynthesis protein B